eukprot:3921352-Prymnesium_polylepis.1
MSDDELTVLTMGPRELSARHERRSSFATCLQILNTILGGGAGIVPLPHAMHLAGGFRTGLTILMLCGALS